MSEPRRDSGMTLVEVVITTVLLALVVTVISAAVIVIFKSEAGVVRLTSESHDTQQGVNYFTLDIQAGPASAADYVTATAAGCLPPDSSVNVLQFVKDTTLVSYRVTDLGDTARLDRHTCDDVTLLNHEVVNIADRLDGTVAQPAIVQPLTDAEGRLQSITLEFEQNGANVTVVASPRAEPLGSPGDCLTQNPISASHGYGVFVEGDVTLVSGQVTGWLGLGGEVTWLNDLAVATDNMSAVSPAFGLYAGDAAWDAFTRRGTRPITSLSVAAGVATATAPAHGYTTGRTVRVDGTGNADIDGNEFVVTVVDANSFRFSVGTADTSDLFGVALAVTPVATLGVVSELGTVTTTGAHGLAVNDRVVIDGTGDAALDQGVFVVTAVTPPSSFQFSAVAVPDTTLSSGWVRKVSRSRLEVGRDDVGLEVAGPVEVTNRVYEATGSIDNYIDMTAGGNPDLLAGANLIPFADDFDELRDCSAQVGNLLSICFIDGCANEVDVTVDNIAKTVNACSSGPVPQVMDIPESFLTDSYTFTSTGPGCQGFSQTRPLIVNVISDDQEVIINTSSTDWTALGDRKNILFNFPNASHIVVRSTFYGQILAPFAHVDTLNAVQGGVIAQSWTHYNGTITSHNDLYDNPIDWP